MKIKKIFLAGFLVWISSTIIASLTCGWLFNWVYQIPPIIWVSPEQMMSTQSLILSNIIGIFSGILFSLVYAFFHKGIPGEGIKKGVNYGFFLWLVGALSGMANMAIFMTIANTVIIYWIIQALVINIINGIIVAKIYK